MTWKKLSISHCQKFHVLPDGNTAYLSQFDNVLAFHAPGLAPVIAGSMSWHIRPDGMEAYPHRFHRTFGFYCDLATVVDNSGWFHINPNGEAIYEDRYAWAGNFQSNRCTVCNSQGNYFHIDINGNPINQYTWQYCGDYREGIAVVQNEQGLSSHIDFNGDIKHNKWFDDLDVFHKGYARAKNDEGWFHINAQGSAIYDYRFNSVEPFYNGYARVETKNGGRIIINECGDTVRVLRQPATTATTATGTLSSKLVGFWKTLAIGSAVEIGIIDALPLDTVTLSEKLGLDLDRMTRLLEALAEIDIVIGKDNLWLLSDTGSQLSSQHPLTLADAALEYKGDLMRRWQKLPEIIKGKQVEQDVFHHVTASKERLESHQRMLNSYAMAEYPVVIEQLNLEDGIRIFDAGGGTGATCNLLRKKLPAAEITLGELPEVLSISTNTPTIRKHPFDLHQTWNVDADCVILAKVIHDWNDTQALTILQNAYNSLSSKGTIILLEMVIQENGYSGSLCDLHLLTVTGGQERRLSHYQSLLEKAGFTRIRQSEPRGLISAITGEKGQLS